MDIMVFFRILTSLLLVVLMISGVLGAYMISQNIKEGEKKLMMSLSLLFTSKDKLSQKGIYYQSLFRKIFLSTLIMVTITQVIVFSFFT